MGSRLCPVACAESRLYWHRFQPPFSPVMQAFLLILESEWKELVSRVARLEDAEQQQSKEKTALPVDEILNVLQAATRLGMTPEGIRKARRAGRLKGVRLNEKEWGFYISELHCYQNRYNRYDRLAATH